MIGPQPPPPPPAAPTGPVTQYGGASSSNDAAPPNVAPWIDPDDSRPTVRNLLWKRLNGRDDFQTPSPARGRAPSWNDPEQPNVPSGDTGDLSTVRYPDSAPSTQPYNTSPAPTVEYGEDIPIPPVVLPFSQGTKRITTPDSAPQPSRKEGRSSQQAASSSHDDPNPMHLPFAGGSSKPKSDTDSDDAREPSLKKNREWITWKEEIADALDEGQSLGDLFGESFYTDSFEEFDYVFHAAADVKPGSGEILITGDLAKCHILSADEVFSLVYQAATQEVVQNKSKDNIELSKEEKIQHRDKILQCKFEEIKGLCDLG